VFVKGLQTAIADFQLMNDCHTSITTLLALVTHQESTATEQQLTLASRPGSTQTTPEKKCACDVAGPATHVHAMAWSPSATCTFMVL
jgi:hypothetical protein